MSNSRDDYIRAWMQAAQALAHWKEQERKLRDFIVGAAFPGAKDGSHNLDLGNGYTLKAVLSTNTKVDANAIDGVLDLVRRLPNGYTIADNVIRWKPDLVMAEYKSLSEQEKSVLAPAITTKPAAPTLEVVPPDAK